MDTDAGQEATGRRRNNPFRAKKVFAIVLGVTFIGLFFSQIWVFGAICPKCLQGASIIQVRVGRVPLFQWTRHERHMHLKLSWLEPTSPIPNEIRPQIYEEIFGERCRHKMKKSEFGASSWASHWDGASFARSLYQPRIEAVAALYSVFHDLPDKRLAQRTYALIDSMLPMDKEKRLYDVQRIGRLRESGRMSDQEIEDNWPVAFPLFQSIEQLKRFTVRLREIRSEEEWMTLLNDFGDQPED